MSRQRETAVAERLHRGGVDLRQEIDNERLREVKSAVKKVLTRAIEKWLTETTN